MIHQSREDKGDRPVSTLCGLHAIVSMWYANVEQFQLGVLTSHSGGYMEEEYLKHEMS
jgi:hypothetical protein